MLLWRHNTYEGLCARIYGLYPKYLRTVSISRSTHAHCERSTDTMAIDTVPPRLPCLHHSIIQSSNHCRSLPMEIAIVPAMCGQIAQAKAQQWLYTRIRVDATHMSIGAGMVCIRRCTRPVLDSRRSECRGWVMIKQWLIRWCVVCDLFIRIKYHPCTQKRLSKSDQYRSVTCYRSHIIFCRIQKQEKRREEQASPIDRYLWLSENQCNITRTRRQFIHKYEFIVTCDCERINVT